MQPEMKNVLIAPRNNPENKIGKHLDISVYLKINAMKTITKERLRRKYGRRALILYLIWCTLKGLFFLFAGTSLFRHISSDNGNSPKVVTESLSISPFDTGRLPQFTGNGNWLLFVAVLLAVSAIVAAVRWLMEIERRDYNTGPGNRFLEEMDDEMFS